MIKQINSTHKVFVLADDVRLWNDGVRCAFDTTSCALDRFVCQTVACHANDCAVVPLSNENTAITAIIKMTTRFLFHVG